MNDTSLLSIRDLRIVIGAQAAEATVVDGVDLEVAAGEAVGLVGESGCGKTTTLRAILRLMLPQARISSGTIMFDGQDLCTVSKRDLRRVRGGQIGVIWQDPLAALDPVMRVGAQIAETIRAHEQISRQLAMRRAMELMRLVELPDIIRIADAYPHELSGGQRQRVVIACAIASSPALLLADEPTTALDVTVQAQILGLLRRLRDELDLALVLVSHDLAVVNETCERVAVMYAGRIVETGLTGSVLASPTHPYTRGLLQAAPSIEHIGRLPSGIPGSAPASAAEQGCAFAPRCSRADERCTRDQPTLYDDHSPPAGHRAACWHPVRPVTPALPGEQR